MFVDCQNFTETLIIWTLSKMTADAKSWFSTLIIYVMSSNGVHNMWFSGICWLWLVRHSFCTDVMNFNVGFDRSGQHYVVYIALSFHYYSLNNHLCLPSYLGCFFIIAAQSAQDVWQIWTALAGQLRQSGQQYRNADSLTHCLLFMSTSCSAIARYKHMKQ